MVRKVGISITCDPYCDPYCDPFEDIDLVLVPLTTLLGTYPNDNVVLVGDFNAKSMI